MVVETKAKTRKPDAAEKKARQSLADIAYEELKFRIITLVYEPGSYLNEAKLSDDLEIGRTPIHHAVRRLTHEGLIEMIPRKGLIVKAISLQEVSEIIDLRLVNEVYCAGQASERMTPTAEHELEAILKEAEEFAENGDIQSQMMLDRRFHDKIAQTAGNQVLAEVLRNLHERSMRIWFVSLNNETHADRVRSDHWDILNALKSGERAKAEAAMEQHILAFKTNIGKLL
jgi:DNA-binding GntR family transcriptional regulator